MRGWSTEVNCSQKLTDNFSQLGNPSTKWHILKKIYFCL